MERVCLENRYGERFGASRRRRELPIFVEADRYGNKRRGFFKLSVQGAGSCIDVDPQSRYGTGFEAASTGVTSKKRRLQFPVKFHRIPQTPFGFEYCCKIPRGTCAAHEGEAVALGFLATRFLTYFHSEFKRFARQILASVYNAAPGASSESYLNSLRTVILGIRLAGDRVYTDPEVRRLRSSTADRYIPCSSLVRCGSGNIGHFKLLISSCNRRIRRDQKPDRSRR